MYEPSVVDEKCVQWNKENFYVGGGVFLTPGVHSFPFDLSEDVDLAAVSIIFLMSPRLQ